jgi:tetratricopeptide (TPR) repeat protein
MSDRFPRRVATALLLAACAVCTPAARAQSASPRPKLSFDELYQRYAGGDHDIVASALVTGEDFQALNPPRDDRRVRRWLGTWDRRKAAFLLEFAGAERLLSRGHFLTALAAGREYVSSRPSPPGQDPAEDAFELAWHQAALGLLEERLYWSGVDAYVEALSGRYGSDAAGARVDGRILLAHGIAQEQRCWLERQAPDGHAIDAATKATRDAGLKEAVRRYAAAATVPEVANEANVRSAWVQFQLGAHADALRTIDLARPTGDNDLTYWMYLFRGRILDALNRQADAERAYRSALAVRPFAQSAAVGLALTLLRLERPDEAQASAVYARQQPADASDPWWTYFGADARFVLRWRAELRLGLEK